MPQFGKGLEAATSTTFEIEGATVEEAAAVDLEEALAGALTVGRGGAGFLTYGLRRGAAAVVTDLFTVVDSTTLQRVLGSNILAKIGSKQWIELGGRRSMRLFRAFFDLIFSRFKTIFCQGRKSCVHRSFLPLSSISTEGPTSLEWLYSMEISVE